jgi:hypothetical protein
MTVANEDRDKYLDGLPTDADALYRQGMAHYRAREWLQARECFRRLRSLAPERRGIDSLINELEHFIRLEEVRPAVARPSSTVIPPDAPSALPAARRAWALVVPGLLAVLLVAVAALAGSGLFAQGATPSPSPAGATALLTARVLSGAVMLSAGGTESWVVWTNGRLLALHDRIRMGRDSAIELTLRDGKATLHAATDAIVQVTSITPDGEAAARQESGEIRFECSSKLFQLETAFLTARVLSQQASYRTIVGDQWTALATDAGQVAVTAGNTSLVVAASEQVTIGPNLPLRVQAQITATATPTPTRTPSATPTLTVTPPATPTATATVPAFTATPTAVQPRPSATPIPAPPTATAPSAGPATPIPAPPTPTPQPAAPTNTPAPPPTATPPPPTNTPAPTATRKR